MGMAGVLDSARLRYFIAEELGVSPPDVEAMTLGSHGDAMIAAAAARDGRRQAAPRAGRRADARAPLSSGRATAAPRSSALLKKGSAYYAPSASIAQMVEAIADDTQEVLPVCAWVHGPVRDLTTSTSACRRSSAAAASRRSSSST